MGAPCESEQDSLEDSLTPLKLSEAHLSQTTFQLVPTDGKNSLWNVGALRTLSSNSRDRVSFLALEWDLILYDSVGEVSKAVTVWQ